MVNSTFGENIPKQCVSMAIVLWHEGQKALALTVDPEGKFMARRFKKAPKEWLGKLTKVNVPPGEYRVQVDKPTFRRLGNMAIDEAIKTAEALGGTSGRSRSRASGAKKSRRSRSSSKASVAAISQVQRSAQAAGRQKAQAQDARQDARKLRELQKAVGQSAARAQSAARVQQAQAIRAQVQKQQAVQRAQREVSAQSRQK